MQKPLKKSGRKKHIIHTHNPTLARHKAPAVSHIGYISMVGLKTACRVQVDTRRAPLPARFAPSYAVLPFEPVPFTKVQLRHRKRLPYHFLRPLLLTQYTLHTAHHVCHVNATHTDIVGNRTLGRGHGLHHGPCLCDA